MVEGICMLFFGQRFTGKGTITTTKKYTQQTFTCSKFTIKRLEEGVNMFNVNNKDTRNKTCFCSVSIAFLLLTFKPVIVC